MITAKNVIGRTGRLVIDSVTVGAPATNFLNIAIYIYIIGQMEPPCEQGSPCE